MKFQQFVDESLGNATHLVIAERSGVAALIDPLRDVDRYLDAAASMGVRITHVFETHIHNDFVSGSREPANRNGARIGASSAAQLPFEHLALGDGDAVVVGDVRSLRPGGAAEHA